MKLEAFATLDAVLQTGSFADAADQVNMTASAVSMQMRQLEVYLGRPLFDRSGHRVRAMPLAHEVTGLMGGALQGLEALRRRSSVEVQGAVRLGVLHSMQPIVLPGLIVALRERHPKLTLQLERGRSSALTAAVRAAALDTALVAEPGDGGSSRLHWRPMLRRELVLIAPGESTEPTVAALFKRYEWIRYDRETISGTLAAGYVSANRLERRGSLELDSVAAIVAMVSAGLGVSIVQIADPAVARAYPVRVVRLGRAAPVLQLSLVSRRSDADNRAHQAIAAAMRSVLTSAVARR